MPLLWRISQGAYRKVAPFAFLALWGGAAAAAPRCPADRIDERVTVSYLYDGDTVRLSDGRKVRLIGIDTPEIGHRGEPSQPLAKEAKRALETRLRSSGMKAGLRFDAERRDRYGRILAHLYAPGGSDLGAELLAEGLASTLAVPPNLWNLNCLAREERAARAEERGVWKLPAYKGVDSTKLPPSAEGFHRVLGKVKRVGKSKKSLWINMEGGLAVRIPRRYLRYFDSVELLSLRGRRIEVRGRIYADRGRPEMTLQHPSAMSVVP